MAREFGDQDIVKVRDILEAEEIEGEKALAVIEGMRSEGLLPPKDPE